MRDADWYRLGDGYLGLRSEHDGFRTRFAHLFGDCADTPPAGTNAPVVCCDVRIPPPGDVSLIQFVDPEPLDTVSFAVSLFADRGCRELTSHPDRRSFGLPAGSGAVALTFSNGQLVACNSEPWEWLVGNIAVHRLIRLQSGVAVMHAASIAIRNRGVLVVGPKGSGKTTLALAAAARGHALLGDEIAAVRLQSLDLLPVRRSVSVRRGPRSPRVDAVLSAANLPEEVFPDGTPRIRARIERLFAGNSAQPTRLSTVVFLRSIGRTARVEPTRLERHHLRQLTPLGSTLWHMPPAERAVRLLGVLSKSRCVFVDVGDPDETIDLLEKAVQDPWD